MSEPQFVIRRKVFTLFGAQFHMYRPDGGLMGYCRQKAFKLKEDIRVYTDESMATEKLVISARSIIDFSAAYDVVESATGETLGTLQRQGLASMFRDSWKILDPDGIEIGTIQEESSALAFLRRFIDFGNLIPQKFHLVDETQTELAFFHTHFNPFIHRMSVEILPECHVSPYLIMAAGLLLMAIEGRQG